MRRRTGERAPPSKRPSRRAAQIGDAEAIDEREALLRDAVRRRMIADVPLGAFLSGGIDSTAVVALMQAQSGARVRTFTIGFPDPAYDERRAAAAVAAHLGTDHTEPDVHAGRRAGRDPAPAGHLRRAVRRLVADPDDPRVGAGAAHVTVALSGDGGDEVFGGYTRHVWAEQAWRRIRPLAARWCGGAPPPPVPASAREPWTPPPRSASACCRPAPGSGSQATSCASCVRLLDARDIDDVYRYPRRPVGSAVGGIARRDGAGLVGRAVRPPDCCCRRWPSG